MNNRIVTVFGGTGFVGSYIVKALAKSGYNVNVVSRIPELANDLKVDGPVGKIVLSTGNIRDDESIRNAVKNSYAVINAVGILYETTKQRFETIHAQCAEKIAKISKESGVERFIHISALGIDKTVKSKYARSKLNGEKAVLSAFPEANIIRPSVVFGVKDNFFNLFASLSAILPALPLIGGGQTKFQPVYAGDIAKGIVKILDDQSIKSQVFEFGGPKVYTFKEIIEIILHEVNRKKLLVPLPFAFAELIGIFTQVMPKPILTVDQVRLLKSDNIVSSKNNFQKLNIKQTYVETVIPDYSKKYKKAS